MSAIIPRNRHRRSAPVKLRIKGDSLRLRLSQGEMRSLAEHGETED
ncbi:MAG: DUF7009 family protein, partial [Steroidobacteraceae bacterium]